MHFPQISADQEPQIDADLKSISDFDQRKSAWIQSVQSAVRPHFIKTIEAQVNDLIYSINAEPT